MSQRAKTIPLKSTIHHDSIIYELEKQLPNIQKMFEHFDSLGPTFNRETYVLESLIESIHAKINRSKKVLGLEIDEPEAEEKRSSRRR